MQLKVHARPLALALAILAACCGLAGFAPAASAAESTTITLNTVGSAPVDMGAPLGFMDAVKVALARSEALRTTQISIESSKITEKDVWYRLFPKLNLAVAYNSPVIQDSKNPTRYKESVNLSFNTGSYDPITAYLGHDVSRAAVKLAELQHVVAIEEMMQKIGLAFIKMDSLDAEIACRKDSVAEMESLAQYTAKKLEAGTIAKLDHDLVEQRLSLARQELRQAVRTKELTRRGLKRLIGLDSLDSADFATANATQKLTDMPNVDEALRPEALQKNSVQIRALLMREKLEGHSITLAKAGHIPKFSFGFNTPDPMSNQGGHLPYYLVMQTTVPVWAWGETLRDTDRARLRQQDARVKSRLLLQSIQQTTDEMRAAMQFGEESVALLNTTAQLRQLEATRKEIAYNANSGSYENLILARQAAIQARLDALKAQTSLDQERLKLRVATGGLLSDHIQVNYGELEKD